MGEALKRLRTERRITPTVLARRSGISRARIYAIEGGKSEKPYSDTLSKLATGLARQRDGKPDAIDQAGIFHLLEVAAGYVAAEPESPNDQVARVLANHPNIRVAFAQVDELDEDDANMIATVVEHAAKRGAEKRQRDKERLQ